MRKVIRLSGAILLAVLIHSPARADMVSFDFDDIQSQSKKRAKAADIELYMESLYGADIFVSRNTASAKSRGSAGTTLLQSPSTALGIHNGYLKIGKGKGSGISFDFGDNPIHSFSVDWLLRKRGKSFTILADGVVINQQILSKAQRKVGASGHQDAYFFDSPVRKLEFVGLKKKSFAIDNLVINIPLLDENEAVQLPQSFDFSDETEENEDGTNGNGNSAEIYLTDRLLDSPPANVTATAAVPEPSSWLMFVLGLCGAWASRRIAV